jgi:outer membrane protein assembly factor BamB
MILFSEKKEVFKYNPAAQSVEWKNSFEKPVSGVFRVENYVFVTSVNGWGSPSFTTLIDYISGKQKWTTKNVLYGIHIHQDSIVFVDSKKQIVSISINTGEEKFKVKMSGFRWYETLIRISLIDNKIYIFSKRKTFILNETTGSLRESKLPNKINPKEVVFLIDEFEMQINTLPGSGSVDSTGAMMAGGDAGGGGDGGGGE